MKKFLSFLLVAVLAVGLCAVAANAADPVRVDVYDGAAGGATIWSHTQTGDPLERTVTFYAATDLLAFGFPIQWNSNGENAPLVTYDFEIFKFNKDVATSVSGTALYKETVTPSGDFNDGIRFDFGKTLGKDKYVARIHVTSSEGYAVFPGCTPYPSDMVSYEPNNAFAFYLEFAKEASEYLLDLNGKSVAPSKYSTKSNTEEAGGVGVWMREGSESVTVKFRTAGAFTGLNFGGYWCSNPTATGAAADWKVELFKFVGNTEYSTSKAPVASVTMHSESDGDPALNFTFDEQPAGAYVVKVTVTNPRQEHEKGKPYLVLPAITNPDPEKFVYSTDAFKLNVIGEDVEGDFYLAVPAEGDAPADDPDDTPADNPGTSDAAVIAIAAVACLALAGVVVAKKVR